MKNPIFIAVFVFLISGCAEDQPALSESFFRIYDDTDADVSYDPVDVVETEDGFMLLTGTELEDSDFDGVALIKVDEEGSFESRQVLGNLVLPKGDMLMNPADSIAYFLQ